MPKLLRLRLCNIGPQRARMEDLTLSLEDIISGQAVHTAIFLRNGGGKTTLISLILWLFCPDQPMPDKNDIRDFVLTGDRSVLVAEWQMDQQPSLWNGKPERYLTGVFCEWRPATSQEGKKLQRFFFATRVIEDEPRLNLESLPLFVSRQGRLERRNLAGFRQEWRELDHAYPQAEVEFTETLTTWREILERIGVDSELFRYQIRMNTHEGGAAEPFLFQKDERFIDFFLELMGEAATGDAIAATIHSFRQELLYLRQQIDPEYRLLQTLTKQFSILCGVAEERDHLYDRVRIVHQEMKKATSAVDQWLDNWQQELEKCQQKEQAARDEYTRQKDEAGRRRRRALLLRYVASQKRVERLQREVEVSSNVVQEQRRHAAIWRAVPAFRDKLRARAKVEGIEAQLRELVQEHQPLLQMLQASARRYAAALSARALFLRAEEHHLRTLVQEQHQQATQLRDQATQALLAAQEQDRLARSYADKLIDFRTRQKQMEEQGIMKPGERWEDAQKRLLLSQKEALQKQRNYEDTIEFLEEKQQKIQNEINILEYDLSDLRRQIGKEQEALQRAQAARQQIANDQVLHQYLEVTDLDFDHLTPQALELLKKVLDVMEEHAAQHRHSLAEQQMIIDYLLIHGLLPPAQAVVQVQERLKQERITAWSGWEYLAESVAEADRRTWLRRLPELAFGVVLPDEQWEKALRLLEAASLYLETPVVLFAHRDFQENMSVRGWAIGPTSDAYFNARASSHELSDRQMRYEQEQKELDKLIEERAALKRSLNFLEQTFEHYSTAWWNNHQQILADTQARKESVEGQRSRQEQELKQCKVQLLQQKREQKLLQENLQTIQAHIAKLQAHEAVLTIDPDAVQEKAQQYQAQAEVHGNEARKFQNQAAEKDREADEAARNEKQMAEEARIIEEERGKVDYLDEEAPAPSPGDLSILRGQYESLREHYHQEIGANELSARREDAQKELQQAHRQLAKRLREGVSEQEIQEALSSLTDPDEAEDQLAKVLEAKGEAENEAAKKREQQQAAQEVMQEIKKRLTTQGIDEHEGREDFPASEEDCDHAAEEEERQAASNDQVALQQKAAEQEAQQGRRESSLKIESLGRVQNHIRTIENGYAPLLTISASVASSDSLESAEGELPIDLREENVDRYLQELEKKLKNMQGEKENLDIRGKESTQVIVQALTETSNQFKEVSLAKRLREHKEEAYEQHCRALLTELNDRQLWIQEQREHLLVHRNTLIQQILALAETGCAFLNSATKYSRLPATLPAFEQRPFLRIQLTEPISREERLGKVADLLDSIIEAQEKELPTGLQLLQQAVRRLANPIRVHILFPDSGDLHYVAPTTLSKESGGERLTSMVLLYCTLLNMRASQRTKPAGKSCCLILDNPIGIASRALFLELQREVAQAMDIQLIYTTAIKDFEALHIFPNLIRIRNDQRDRRTGHLLLTLETPAERLETMRLMHAHDRDFADEHQEHS
jgi:hypothetical protein